MSDDSDTYLMGLLLKALLILALLMAMLYFFNPFGFREALFDPNVHRGGRGTTGWR
jgi:hypothetical protein